jgi:uncharacterized protein (TIGR02270 family)
MNAVPQVLDQHAEDAAFLAGLRDYAVRAPHYDLKHLAVLDARLEAHLDGLLVAGAAGLDRLLGALTAHANGEVFAATVLAFRTDSQSALKVLIEHLRSAPEGQPAFAAAIGWLEWQRVESRVEQMLASADPIFRRLGLAACGQHRQDPGNALLAALGNADADVLARAARTAGELRRHDLMQELRRYRSHEHVPLRFWSNWATAQLGDQEALAVLRQFAEQHAEYQADALPVLLAWQPRETSMAWIRELTQDPLRKRLAISATGLFGDPQAIPWLIRQMQELPYARAAGEAFCLISGADLAELDLELQIYPDYDAGPNDDPQDPNVEMDLDSDLAWPDPARVSAWWQANGARFAPGMAYLCGDVLTEKQCLKVLNSGWQRQRLAAACLLARLQPKQVLFPCAAPVARQRSLLAG